MKIPLVIFFAMLACGLQGQQFQLGDEVRDVPDSRPSLPIYPYSPDGHITMIPEGQENVMYWPGEDSYRTAGKTVFEMAQSRKVLSAGGASDFDNGGAWLYSVFPQIGGRAIGFYHAEDHRFPGDPASKFIAYKSIARCESTDGGRTWKKDTQILTAAKPKPEAPEWSGLGDHCTVWDRRNDRYICFFQEEGILRMAMSTDPEGKPRTWKKWFEGAFSEPGLGGVATPIANLDQVHGGNPSVHWNTFLQRWIMVYHSWPGSLMLSQSDDLVSWSVPVVLLEPAANSKLWYATILGEADTIAGETATLVYADFPDSTKPERKFVAREITFLNPEAR